MKDLRSMLGYRNYSGPWLCIMDSVLFRNPFVFLTAAHREMFVYSTALPLSMVGV